MSYSVSDFGVSRSQHNRMAHAGGAERVQTTDEVIAAGVAAAGLLLDKTESTT